MSTVLIIRHNENIINLIPKIVEEYVKTPRYRSKHEKKVRKGHRDVKSSHRTFGVACIPLDPPSQYLKKRSRVEPRKIEKHVHPSRPGYQRELPTWVPLKRVVKGELPDMPVDSATLGPKNFKLLNILNVKRSCPRKPKKRYVDTRYGSVHDLEPSGLLPIYILSKDYGRTPDFILESDHERMTKAVDEVEGEAHVQPLCRYVTAEERANLLHGMKKKWDELTLQFQRLPFLTDTTPKIKKKSGMEDDLRQLEKDIEIIERHPYIYVHDDVEED